MAIHYVSDREFDDIVNIGYIKDQNLIYKYLDLSGGIKMLENSTVRFTHIRNLNDPFDCYRGLLDYSFPDNFKEKIKDYAKQKALAEGYDVENIVEKSLTILSSLNDANSTKKLENIFIFSSTIDPLSILMWSYYNNHQGICVGINTCKLIDYLFDQKKDIFPIKVVYKNKLPKHKFFVDEKNEEYNYYLHNTVGIKYSGWKHEKEIRIALLSEELENEQWDDIKIPPEFIEEIYLGSRIHFDENKEDEILQLKKLLKDKYEHIRKYICNLSVTNFRLKHETLNEAWLNDLS